MVSSKKSRAARACPHVKIERVRPCVEEGRYPAKRIAGAPCSVEATAFRDGHAKIEVSLLWRPEGTKAVSRVPMELVNPGLDLWRGSFPLEKPGKYFFTIEAWTDTYGTWLEDLAKRVEADQKVDSEALEGAALVERTARRAKGGERNQLKAAAAQLRAAADDPHAALEAASDPDLLEQMRRLQSRADAVRHEQERAVLADRPLALFGAWYEMFPRSQGVVPGRASTFREAERRLGDIAEMGFDVLYLPPIHPIGKTNRKGPNNALVAGPDDPGSPWAIGNEHGGHDAVEPALGTLEDFDHFVEAARDHGLEIALDFALQCSPDHPWVKEHPAWFYHRPDGTIKFAENPPKKYEDIYPIDFDTPDRDALWREMLRILEFWIGHGVQIFRVDNPHTKPLCFWEWLIGSVKEKYPDVIFLAEAFTRPPMMQALARLGFTQSYTYFTWRESKGELKDYMTELTQEDKRDCFRPNFFVNTPDILPRILVEGGRPAFKMRLVLAATLSPSYGIYSGYELCENEWMPHHAIPGEVEYLNSEKFEIRVRDWDAPGNIKDFITRLNTIRLENPALQELDNVRFLRTDNPRMLLFAKSTADLSNILLVAVNLDPRNPHHCTGWVPLEEIGVAPGENFFVKDLLTGARYAWGDKNYIRLDPQIEPSHILLVERKAT